MLKPIGDSIIVKLDKLKDVSDGGVILPDIAQIKQGFGEVVAVSDDFTLDVSVGDKVLVNLYGNTEFEWNRDKLMLVKEYNVFAKL